MKLEIHNWKIIGNNKKLYLLIIFICGFVLTNLSLAHFGQKYEPVDGRVIHGLGQYVSIGYTDAENWQYVTEYQDSVGYVPVIYSTYVYLDPKLDNQDYTDLNDIIQNHRYPYILVIGLVLADSTSDLNGNINIPVNTILNGDLDYRIIEIAQRIKLLNSPVYLRPGFEFGKGNSGLHDDNDNPDWTAANFRLIWRRIYSIFTEQNVTNVAWVWNTVNPSSFNFMDWYPGDDYVDWFGINYFTTSQISSGDSFLDSAATHQKPVMISESNPIQNGGTTNAANWENWFIPYFNKISTYPHIKAFIYISDPWNKPEFFGSWPDSRITTNSTILSNYRSEMSDPKYIHMDDYQISPWLIDISLPVTLTQFCVEPRTEMNLVQWETASEINNLGFNLYRAANREEVSMDQLHFEKINQDLIPGAGNSSEPQKYFFKDRNIRDYYYYWYKLEDIDYNGHKNIHDAFMIYRPNPLFQQVQLYQNYPNPFNEETRIKIFLPFKQSLTFSVFTLNGQLVYTNHLGIKGPGFYLFDWNGKTSNDISLPSGVYFYRISSGKRSFTRSLIIIR